MNIHTFIILFCFLFLSSCSPDIISSSGVDYFTNHSLLNLIGWFCFPRIMFWFFSAITGGFFFWLGVFIAPKFMVAYWATQYYWDTNPVICVIAWIVAIASPCLGAKGYRLKKNRNKK